MKELQIIQSKLKAPKGQTNAFGKYKYRSCEDIMEAVKPLLEEQKCCLVVSDEIIQKGDRYYVKATAEIYRGDQMTLGESTNSGQMAETMGDESNIIEGYAKAHAYAREPAEKKGMDLAQLTGATSSYARKYALNGLFCIDDTKDADTMKPPATVVKAPKRADLNKALTACKTPQDYDKVLKGFNTKYPGAFELLSGHPTNKSEVWSQLFRVHFDRITGNPPVDANTSPDELQAEWSIAASTCQDKETMDMLETQVNQNKALAKPDNWKILQSLHLAFD